MHRSLAQRTNLSSPLETALPIASREPQQRRISAAVHRGSRLRAAPVTLPLPRMRLLAVLVTVAVVIGATVVGAWERQDVRPSRPDASASAVQGEPLPAPDVALPHTPGALAATLSDTTRRLRVAIDRWDAAGAVPRDVTLLALHERRMLRLLTARRALGDATLARLTPDLRADARATVLGRRDLAAIPRSPGRLPRVRVASAAPAAELRRYYGEAQRRFGINWSVLAAINFVESAFGRVRIAVRPALAGRCSSCPRRGASTEWAATSTTRATRASAPPTTCTARALRVTWTGRFWHTTTRRATCARSAASPAGCVSTSGRSSRTTHGRSTSAPRSASGGSPARATTESCGRD